MKNKDNFLVQCPNDWETNQKWKDIIAFINNDYQGDQIGFSYGKIRGIPDCTKIYDKKEKELVMTIDEAHSMLFDNVLIEKPKTTAGKLAKLGFKRVELKDDVFFKEHQFYPFSMCFGLSKSVTLEWTYSVPEDDVVTLGKNGDVLHKFTVKEAIEIVEKFNKNKAL